MAWTIDFTDYAQSWRFVKQFWYALRERAWCAGIEYLTLPSDYFAMAGVITGQSGDGTTLYLPAGFGDAVGPYDVCIDHQDPHHVTRHSLVSHTSTSITIAPAVTEDVTGREAVVILSGLTFWHDRWPVIGVNFMAGYTGLTEQVWTHDPTCDGLTTIAKPDFSIVEGETTLQVWDTDQWRYDTDPESPRFGLPISCYAPHFFRCLRGLQILAEGLVGNFIQPSTRDLNHRDNYTMYCPALWFADSGIGLSWSGGSAIYEDGTCTIANTGDYPRPCHCWYALTCADALLGFGEAQIDGSGNVTVTWPHPSSTTYNGKTVTVTIALGWDRRVPAEIRYMYPQTYFLPDVNIPTTGEPTAIDPPQEDAGSVSRTGQWITIAADSTYSEVGEGSPMMRGNGFEPLHTGDNVRYTGSNQSDPLTTEVVTEETTAGYWPTVPYQVHGKKCGKVSPTASFGDGDLSGAISTTDKSGPGWLDTGLTLYEHGIMLTHTGTASGGSSSTLSDTTQSASAFWTAGRGRPEGFVLGVSDGTAWHEALIASRSGTTLAFDAATMGITVTAGMSYRWIEPKYILHRWIGRALNVTITRADLSTETYAAVLLGNSAGRVFFSSATDLTLSAGDSLAWSIADPPTGTVWQRTSTGWQSPLIDGEGHHYVDYRKQKAVGPTILQRYGRARTGDYLSAPLFSALRSGILNLWVTEQAVTWYAHQKGASVDELRYRSFIGDNETDYAMTDASRIAAIGESVEDGLERYPYTAGGGTPYRTEMTHLENPGMGFLVWGTFGTVSQGYPAITFPPPARHLTGSVKFYGRPSRAGTLFDSNGGMFTENQWNYLEAASKDTDQQAWGALYPPGLGVLDGAYWPVPPTPGNLTAGFHMDDTVAVVEWGGFVYSP